jgi:hypothetical protein
MKKLWNILSKLTDGGAQDRKQMGVRGENKETKYYCSIFEFQEKRI